MITDFINYFETMPSYLRASILAGGLMLFWFIEGVAPLVLMRYNKWKHAGINIFFTLTTVVVNFALAFLLLWASNITTTFNIGLWQWFNFKLNIFTVLVGLLILDFIGAYCIHWLQHKIKFMWQFHVIHHTDTFLDATSANRHHPGESVFRAIFTGIAIIICGAPFGIVVLYQSLSALLSQFNHANIMLPTWLDKPLSFLIVTPNMHRVHHHYQLPLTDKNYSNIFSIWDRLFGTFANVKNPNDIKFGVDTYPLENENSTLKSLLTIPFRGYRNHKNNEP
jgi:sterol desaturase/sphingolipid hydroxylase (fatty acid hydroxylase superfamily)